MLCSSFKQCRLLLAAIRPCAAPSTCRPFGAECRRRESTQDHHCTSILSIFCKDEALLAIDDVNACSFF